jgi:hypothetical protein
LDIRYSHLNKNRNGSSAAHLRKPQWTQNPKNGGREAVRKRGSKISTKQKQAFGLLGNERSSGVKSKPGRTSHLEGAADYRCRIMPN